MVSSYPLLYSFPYTAVSVSILALTQTLVSGSFYLRPLQEAPSNTSPLGWHSGFYRWDFGKWLESCCLETLISEFLSQKKRYKWQVFLTSSSKHSLWLFFKLEASVRKTTTKKCCLRRNYRERLKSSWGLDMPIALGSTTPGATPLSGLNDISIIFN